MEYNGKHIEHNYETKHKIAEIMKINEQGDLAIRWDGTTEFVTINDPQIALYVFYVVTHTPEQVFQGINSMCR